MVSTKLGRLVREVERRIESNQEPVEFFRELLTLCRHFIKQATGKLESNGEKIYSPHEPHVECIAKGKLHKKYEYGNKVSFVSTDRTNFIVGYCSHRNRPHDSKTLRDSLASVEALTGIGVTGECAVDLGYRGHGIKKKEVRVLHSRLKRLSKSQKNFVRRRSKSESVISYLKRNCRMGVNYLKGVIGDAINGALSAVAYNLRLITRHLVARGTAVPPY